MYTKQKRGSVKLVLKGDDRVTSDDSRLLKRGLLHEDICYIQTIAFFGKLRQRSVRPVVQAIAPPSLLEQAKTGVRIPHRAESAFFFSYLFYRERA